MCTIYVLFIIDFKLLFIDVSVDPTLGLIINYIFLFLFIEFILTIFVEWKEYIGTFIFYLDILALVSLIPDTPFLMHILFPDSHEEAEQHVMKSSHLIQASAASQAAGR